MILHILIIKHFFPSNYFFRSNHNHHPNHEDEVELRRKFIKEKDVLNDTDEAPIVPVLTRPQKVEQFDKITGNNNAQDADQPEVTGEAVIRKKPLTKEGTIFVYIYVSTIVYFFY